MFTRSLHGFSAHQAGLGSKVGSSQNPFFYLKHPPQLPLPMLNHCLLTLLLSIPCFIFLHGNSDVSLKIYCFGWDLFPLYITSSKKAGPLIILYARVLEQCLTHKGHQSIFVEWMKECTCEFLCWVPFVLIYFLLGTILQHGCWSESE